MASYQVTPNAVKHWCKLCGTPLFNTNQIYPGMMMVYLGSILGCEALVPRANIYCSSKLEWVDSVATLKSYAESRQARA